MMQRNLVGQMLTQITDVVPLHRAVDDHIQMMPGVGDHQVIENAAVLVEQQRIAHLARCEGRDVARYDGFECLRHIVAGQPKLSHVRHVEQARIFARPQMLGNDAFILDRHVIAGKLDHPRAFDPMPRVERERFDFLGLVCIAH